MKSLYYFIFSLRCKIQDEVKKRIRSWKLNREFRRGSDGNKSFKGLRKSLMTLRCHDKKNTSFQMYNDRSEETTTFTMLKSS